jgi:hypothetical protein
MTVKSLSEEYNRLFSLIVSNKNLRIISVDFGIPLCRVTTEPVKAVTLAHLFRITVNQSWGDLVYSDNDFPLTIETDEEKHVVYSTLPRATTMLAGNPELFLVWADKLECAANKLLF